jgi:Na+/melibiose symporter-like transporter
VAGVVIQWLTAPVAVLADAVSFVVSGAFVSLIRKREQRPERGPDQKLGRDIMEGLRFVLGNKMLRAIAMCTGSGNFFSAVSYSMLVLFLVRDLGQPPTVLGVIMSVSAVGGLVAAFTATRIARWLGQGPTIWISIAVTAPFAVLWPLAQADWRLWLAAVGGGVWWFGAVVYNITQVSFRQGLTPESLLGRMNATMRFLVWGTLPLGGLVGGLLGQHIGVRQTMWVAAIGGVVTFLPPFLSPLRRMRELPTHPEPAATH